jgi:hypothetical protein
VPDYRPVPNSEEEETRWMNRGILHLGGKCEPI